MKSATKCAKYTPYHSPKLHAGPYSSVAIRPRTETQTDRHTQTRVTTIHFASYATHAKSNKTG